MNTDSRFRLIFGDGASIVVNRINGRGAIFSDVAGWCRAYGCTIRSAEGTLVLRGRDLHGPCGAYTDADAPSAREMTGALLSFLVAAAERYALEPVGAYHPWFSADADEWCYQHREDLATAQWDIEGTADGPG